MQSNITYIAYNFFGKIQKFLIIEIRGVFPIFYDFRYFINDITVYNVRDLHS